MKSYHALSGAGILLFASGLLCGQSIEAETESQFIVPASEELPPIDDAIVLAPAEDLLSEPVPDDSDVPLPTQTFAFDFLFADFELDDGRTTYWTEEPIAVSQAEIAVDTQFGIGVRFEWLALGRDYRLAGESDPLEIRLATYYFDVYRRFVHEQGEFSIGGGLAIGSLKIDSPYTYSPRRFNGVGASLVGDGFYPLWRSERSDFGLTGRARLALLGPVQDNFENDSQAVLVDEFEAGIELRRRFGKRQDKMGFVRLGRAYQHWSDAEFPLDADQSLEGTSLRIGYAW